jgi:pilus assembly protein Flp/PilA
MKPAALAGEETGGAGGWYSPQNTRRRKVMRLLNEALLRVMTWTRREKGQTLVEYALIVGLVSIAAIVIMVLMGTEIGNVFTKITTQLGGVAF